MDDIFFAVISSPKAAKKTPAKIAEKLYNSDWLFRCIRESNGFSLKFLELWLLQKINFLVKID